jgi:hypothetical protein
MPTSLTTILPTPISIYHSSLSNKCYQSPLYVESNSIYWVEYENILIAVAIQSFSLNIGTTIPKSFGSSQSASDCSKPTTENSLVLQDFNER